MTERERLERLLRDAKGIIPIDDDRTRYSVISDIADHLLANGAIVPPCKVGDTIYRCGIHNKVYEWQIAYIEVYPDEIGLVDDSDNYFLEDDIGDSVFLTKEAAEQALKERERE